MKKVLRIINESFSASKSLCHDDKLCHGVEVGVVKEELGGGELVEGARQLLFLEGVSCVIVCCLF